MGIESGIKRIFDSIVITNEVTQNVELIVNIDRLPLFKSSSLELWPIICRFNGLKLFIVSVYCGTKKPNSINEFLKDFLMEYQLLKTEGFLYKNNRYTVSIKAFVCDTPARAFIKCIKSHTGYYSCERCIIKGSYDGQVVFYKNNCVTRNDLGFSLLKYEVEHQKAKSPFIDYNFPCVTGFVLDYMHLVCLGVMRRILNFLTDGPRLCKISIQQINCLSESMTLLNNQMPSEFARQPRSIVFKTMGCN